MTQGSASKTVGDTMKRVFYALSVTFALITIIAIGCSGGGGDSGFEMVENEETGEMKPVSTKPRIFVLTDMGRGDPDDSQSMVHLLLYADIFDIEGLVASTPNGDGNGIRKAVKAYEADYPKLLEHGDYPEPATLFAAVKQGANADRICDNCAVNYKPKGHGEGFTNEGTDHLINLALNGDPRPLHVLIWGSATDLATALLVEPSIAEKLRVYTVGGWNTRQDRQAHSILWNFRDRLYWIDSNHCGGSIGAEGLRDINSRYGAKGFIQQVVKGAGNLGAFYVKESEKGLWIEGRCGTCVKEGDSPSFWMLFPDQPGFDQPDVQQIGGIHPDRAEEGYTYWQDRRGDRVERLKALQRFEERLNRLK